VDQEARFSIKATGDYVLKDNVFVTIFQYLYHNAVALKQASQFDWKVKYPVTRKRFLNSVAVIVFPINVAIRWF
jgi:hypothetical protein